MIKPGKNSLKSKKGFALATVIVVSCVIVILATSLIGIAMSSTEKTSGDINQRQAYLNAKSALDYGATYYSGGTNLPTLSVGATTGEEYILMNDRDGGTTENGAEVVPVTASTDDYMTYVYSLYDRSNATLTLRAYAKSANAFGGRQTSTTLAVTYKLSSAGANTRGKGIPSTTPAGIAAKTSSDEVTIHVRRDPNATGDNYFNPAIYTWSYYRKNGVNWNSVSYPNQANTDFNQISAGKMNEIESEGNKFEPAGKWISNGSMNGPITRMEQDPQSNDWFTHRFSPSKSAEQNGGAGKEMVPWFNLIVSRQSPYVNIGNKANGTQSCEFLNVWYFDESDKHIYVEVQHSPLYYYKGRDWDGKCNLSYYYSGGNKVLQDCVIAYANAPQTVYYVKLNGKTDKSLNPTINVSGFGSGHMSYSGYGWWSFRTSATQNDAPSVTVSGTGISTTTLPVVASGSENPIMGRSAYIVINADGTARSCLTEEAASNYMSDEDYVTVYSKGYYNKVAASPKISYLVETHQTSKAKEKLAAELRGADQLYFADYEATSWNDFLTVVNKAKSVYNNTTLQPNNVYSAETLNVQTAMSNLKYKPVDTTNLQALVDSARAVNGSLYTSESYSALITVCNAAQAIIDSAATGNNAVQQTTVTQKEADLQAKIDALEEVQPYRDALQTKINEGKAAQTSYASSPHIGELNTAISNGEGLLSSNGKTAINNAIADITRAINKVKNAVSTDAVENAIANARAILDADVNNLVEGTVKNLQDTIATAENAINTMTMTEEQVNAYANAVNDAVAKLIYVPVDNTPDIANGKKRVWFDIDPNGLGTGKYYIYAWYTKNGKNHSNVAWAGSSWDSTTGIELIKDTVSGYYYYDLDEKYTNYLIVNKGGVQSADIEYDPNYTLSRITSKGFRDGTTFKYKVKDKVKITTFYSEIDSAWPNTELSTNIYNSTHTELNKINKLTHKDKSGKYYVQRLAYDDGSALSIVDSNNIEKVNIVSGKLSAIPNKPFMVIYPNGTFDANTVEEMLKSKPVTAVSKSKGASASKAYGGSDASVVKTAAADPSYSDTHVDAADSIATVYFKKPTGWSDTVALELCITDDSGNLLSGSTQSGMIMMTDNDKYYYVTVDLLKANTIKISDKNNTSNTTGNVKFAFNSSTGIYYSLQQIDKDASGKYKASQYTSAAAVISTADVTFDSANSDLPMAFVGGRKRLFVNVPDTRSGRNDMCGHGLGGKFSNTDDQGYARVGLTSYNVYYDWYEYKIPAGSTDEYTFQIKGMDNSSGSSNNVVTKQIHQVWGDVWVSLKDLGKDGGKFKNVGISTVNPENNVTQEKTTIYISQNAALPGMQVTMWGAGSQTVTLSQVYDGKYYVEVPQTMPFLQVSSTDGTVRYDKTKLQGGDVDLYDYSAGVGGTPAWLTYVPPYVKLQRERANAESVGRGWAIFEYDNSAQHKITSTKTAEKLSTMANQNLPENNADVTTDANAANARANMLAEWTNAYEDLYNAISNARAYITVDDSGNPKWYPENSATEASNLSYQEDDIKELYKQVATAITEYGNPNASLNMLKSYADDINESINELTPDTSNKATVFLEDSLKWGSGIYVRYKDSSNNEQTRPVTGKNINGIWMIFIDTSDKITDVQFGHMVGGGYDWGSKQAEILAGQSYTYNNSTDPNVGGWNSNSVDNYFVVSGKSYTQKGHSDTKIIGDAATSDDFIIYFMHNTKIKYKRSLGASHSTYTIPAGAYAINIPNYKTYYTGTGAAPSKVDLYSEMAENFFTDPVNQGFSKNGVSSETIGWTVSGRIRTHSGNYTNSSDVNFVADSGALNGGYTSYGNICFRWNNETGNLSVANGTSFTAKEITFASVSKVTGGNATAPEFMLANDDPNEKVRITFVTKTSVSYKDQSGQLHEFEIPDGTYESVDPGKHNFFDEDFWNNGVKSLDSVDGGESFLTDPIYASE